MKKILVGCLIATTVFAAGCKDISGVLTVSKKLDVLVKGKSQSIESGNHNTDLDFKKDRVIAKISTATGVVKVELLVPNGTQIPANGQFELKSTQSGQPFDVLGNVVTTVAESERRSDSQSCQYQTNETVCTPKGCSVYPVTRWGSQWIDYYLRTTDQTIGLNMVSVQNVNDTYAQFSGHENVTEKMITRQSQCL